MATSTRTRNTEPKQDAATPDFKALLKPSQATFSARETKPNPLEGFVAYSREHGPQMIPVTGADQAKEVVAGLRRDAADMDDSGVRIQLRDSKGNVTKDEKAAREVHFSWKKASERTYTVADIRAWYKTTYGQELPKGKVPATVRDEFKASRKAAEQGNVA
jgi:hypothetical protein